MTEDRRKNRTLLLICAALALATIIAYEPIRHNGFVNYDDDRFIVENPNVKGGLTQQSFIWAFTQSVKVEYWIPITWISHMVDCDLYGLNPLGHHINSLLFHIANTVLLFLLLHKMTGAIWKNAFVAAAFALHPAHVESVAWAAERKDVLSTLFWLLTMLAYVNYVKNPNTKNYKWVVIALAMGLMAKPMVITLPFVLLLLDYWPLGRFENFKASFYKLFYEKIPLFAMSAVSCVITVLSGRAIKSMESWPWHARIVTSLENYFYYITKILCPKNLAVLYPLPEHLSIQLAGAVLLIMILLLYFPGRSRRWFAVGLLWYIVTLVPVIGLMQAGAQMMADRYTYIPSIGIFIIIAWGIEEYLSKLRYFRVWATAGAAALIITMVLLTRVQTGYWKNVETLFGRAIAVTENNYIMYYDYGHALCNKNRFDEGIVFMKEAARINPQYMDAVSGICTAYLAQNKFDEAISCFNEALQKQNAKDWKGTYEIYAGLGYAYEQKGNLDLAEDNYKQALKLNPQYEFARNSLASVMTKRQKKSND